ncbi:hypothetical protein Droror1_Dr00003959 [Drosera rotundifolia]
MLNLHSPTTQSSPLHQTIAQPVSHNPTPESTHRKPLRSTELNHHAVTALTASRWVAPNNTRRLNNPTPNTSIEHTNPTTAIQIHQRAQPTPICCLEPPPHCPTETPPKLHRQQPSRTRRNTSPNTTSQSTQTHSSVAATSGNHRPQPQYKPTHCSIAPRRKTPRRTSRQPPVPEPAANPVRTAAALHAHTLPPLLNLHSPTTQSSPLHQTIAPPVSHNPTPESTHRKPLRSTELNHHAVTALTSHDFASKTLTARRRPNFNPRTQL